jgi:hypothetical protein
MIMKKIILAMAVVFTAASISFAQTKTAASNTAVPVMKFEKDEHNFGTIRQGDKVTYEFVFENTGNEPLIISQAQGSCGCTVPEYPKNPMKKGEKGTIKVTFDSTGKMGFQDKTITITSNAPDSPKILHVKGTIEQVAMNIAPEGAPMEKPQN